MLIVSGVQTAFHGHLSLNVRTPVSGINNMRRNHAKSEASLASKACLTFAEAEPGRHRGARAVPRHASEGDVSLLAPGRSADVSDALAFTQASSSTCLDSCALASSGLPECTTRSLNAQLSVAVSEDGLPTRPTPHLLVFSGGTAFNSVAGFMRNIYPRVSHVLPVSDDGGSTAEIVRVLGGPAVGDIRSRCLRLADDHNDEAKAVKRLLGHRLAPYDKEAAKMEWYSIVEGNHELWNGVSEPYKHTIRAFLVHFHTTILRQSTEQFSFRNGSVGNFFFAGARTFFRSLDAAIFLFSRVARLPLGSSVIPAISTEERITLGAELANGERLRGQNTISHPPRASSPGSAVVVDKAADDELPMAAPISRICYLSNEGTGIEHEVLLRVNPQVLRDVAASDAIIYGMGSLYTSICPSLILRGVGEAVAERDCVFDKASGRMIRVPKILMLNGSHDRETSACVAHDGPMTAVDFVLAITKALNREGGKGESLSHPPSKYVNTIMVPRESSVHVDQEALTALGVERVLFIPSHRDNRGHHMFDADKLLLGLRTLFVSLGLESGD